MTAKPFPEPGAPALAVSDALLGKIGQEIDAAGGWLGFERFMQMALYEPGLGYYSAGSLKLGEGGDFTTAPEASDWLAAALAVFVAERLGALGASRLLELGAGTGRLAGQLLDELAGRGRADIDYAILEPSADLRERQRAHLDTLGVSVRWLEGLPEPPFEGIVIANEVADAIPVARFVRTGGAILPLGVVRAGAGLSIVPGPPDPVLGAAVAAIEAGLGAPLPEGYRSEVCLMLRPWLAGVFGPIAAGGLLLVDYGMSRRDYYRAERADGTLICHYRQRAHSDSLLWPGLQDISAWVDFSAVAAIAAEHGFSLAGFTTQAQFLLESIARDPVLASRRPGPEDAGGLKTLILPGEMGEHFKLIWLTRGAALGGLPGRDFRNRL